MARRDNGAIWKMCRAVAIEAVSGAPVRVRRALLPFVCEAPATAAGDARRGG